MKRNHTHKRKKVCERERSRERERARKEEDQSFKDFVTVLLLGFFNTKALRACSISKTPTLEVHGSDGIYSLSLSFLHYTLFKFIFNFFSINSFKHSFNLISNILLVLLLLMFFFSSSSWDFNGKPGRFNMIFLLFFDLERWEGEVNFLVFHK